MKKFLGYGEQKPVASQDFSEFQIFSGKAELFRISKEDRLPA